MPRIPLKPYKTPYQSFLDRWGKGCGSILCPNACHVVLAKGYVPCDVVFIGEAPGKSEDALGLPFVGPSGHLLTAIVANAIPESVGDNPTIKVTFTNLVGCIPIYDGQLKEEEPDHDDIMRCQPRLTEFLDICQPKLIVRVGRLAKDYVDAGESKGRDTLKVRWCHMLHIIHPAAIIRASVVHQGLMAQRCEVQIRDAVEEALGLSEEAIREWQLRRKE